MAPWRLAYACNTCQFKLLQGIQCVTRYEPTWESLKQNAVLSWFMDAKLGIFIRSGVCAGPGVSGSHPYHRSQALAPATAAGYHSTQGPDRQVPPGTDVIRRR